MDSKAKIAILSSVKPGVFKDFADNEAFTEKEREKALMDEIDVWRDTVEVEYLRENTRFEVVNVLEGLPKQGEYDGYILGGSPNMVTEDLKWIRELERFIYSEINAGKHAIGFCFGHQVLANAFGGSIDNASERKIGRGEVFLNANGQGDKLFGQLKNNFESIWSHKQYVSNPGEAEVLGDNNHTPNQIIKLGDNAWGCQFHPEFAPEFASFLVKLMSSDIKKEGLDIDKILSDLKRMNGNNESKVVINLFLKNLLK